MANAELLRETLNYIKENPQSWRQSVWFTHIDPTNGTPVNSLIEFEVKEVNSCGSAFCFAGHAALKSGFPAPPKTSRAVWYKTEFDPEKGRDVTTYVDDHARKMLGLNWNQADVLFSADNSLEDLEVLVNALIDNPDIEGSDLEALVRPEDYDEYCCKYCNSSNDDEDDETW